MRRFYTQKENFTGEAAVLLEDETRHLRDVLRLAKGEEVQIFDGEGHEFACVIESVEKKRTLLKVLRETAAEAPESFLDLTLAAAITKGEKFDLVVQKAVELGVTRIVPLFTVRCEVKAGGSQKRMERWGRIAFEAAKQSGRAKLMMIEDPIELSGFIDLINTSENESVVMFSEREGEGFEKLRPGGKMTMLIGPAGGWDDAELALGRANGFQIITLGGRILRAETAAIALTAIIQHRFGDIK